MSNINSTGIKRTDIAVAFILCTLIFVLGFLTLDNNCNWGDDFAAYISDGIAMAQGRYEEQLRLNVILRSGRLVDVESEHVHAWGFPLTHALVHRLAGFDSRGFSQLWLYKLPTLIAFSLMAGIYYLFLRRRLGCRVSVLLCLALCAHTEFFNAIRNLYNDVFFMALSLSSFFLVEKYSEQKSAKSHIIWGLILAVVLWYSYSVRLNGIVTVAAVLLAQLIWLLQKKLRPSFYEFVPVGGFALLYLVFNRLLFPVPTSTSSASDASLDLFVRGCAYYLDQLLDWARHFVEICLDIPVKLAATFMYSVFGSAALCSAVSRAENFINTQLYTAFAVLFLLCALGGMLWTGLKSDPHIVFFIFVSFIGTAALSLGQELRYLYVLLPHLLMYSALFIKKLLYRTVGDKSKHPRLRRAAENLVCAVLCVFAIVPTAGNGLENLTNDAQENITAYSDAAIEVYNFIQDNTGEDATIAFFKPRALYLNTGRVALLPEKDGFSVDDADYYLHYIPMDESSAPEWREQDYQTVFENYEFILYKKLR